MIGKYLTVIVLSTVFALGNTAPRTTRGTSGTDWRQPCASKVERERLSGNAAPPDHNLTLDEVRLIFRNLIRDYEHSCVEHDYEMSIEERHYYPNGVPNKTEIKELQKSAGLEPSKIVGKLPVLYTDLQKFGVAFEELVEDVSMKGNAFSLITTKLAILGTLCGVGDLLTNPIDPIESFTLRPDPDDETFLQTRVWGVVSRFKAYLEVWKLLLGINHQSESDCPASSRRV